MNSKTEKIYIKKDTFWSIRSFRKAFIFRGFELVFLSLLLYSSQTNFPDRDFLGVLVIGVSIVTFLSFVIYEEFEEWNKKKRVLKLKDKNKSKKRLIN